MSYQILRDAAGITSVGGDSNGWVRSPYGVRIAEDPNKAFKTLMEIERFVLAQDADNSEITANVTQWMNILKNVEQSDASSAALNKDKVTDEMAQGKSLYASPNYTDTRVGGNDAINPYWQFNRDDDIVPPLLRIPGMEAFTSGMGRVYAEMYDDNQEILWMRMGVPEFVNVLQFYTVSGNRQAAIAMNQGSIRTLVGKIIRMVFSTAIWAITFPVLAPFHINRWMMKLDSERITMYYYFKPAMPLYYETVNTMLSYLAVGMGLYPTWMFQRSDRTKDLPNDTNKPQPANDNGIVLNADGKTVAQVMREAGYNARSVMPIDISEYSKSGKFSTNDCGIPELLKNGPDIFTIMNRRAMLFNAQRVKVTTRQLMEEQWKRQQETSQYYVNPQPKYEVDKDGNFTEVKNNESKGVFTKSFEALKGTLFGAGDFVGFRIERGLNCTENISNQTGPTGISQKLNQVAQQKRDEFDDTGGGSFVARLAKNLSEKKSIGDFAKTVGMELLAKTASAVGIGDIGAILTDGSGFIDIPEVWKGSSFSKSYSFTIQLRARYGDPTSIFQSIYIPLLMLLAAALPRSVGDNMYTSPFIINAYCKGKFAVPCGMITDMSISRGKDEFGWSSTNLPTAIDVSFSIKDLSPAVFLSMQDIGFFDTFTRNNNLMEYLDTLSALGISERLYLMPKSMRKLAAATLIKKNTIFNPTWWGAKIGRSPAARFLTATAPYANHEKTDINTNATSLNRVTNLGRGTDTANISSR